MFYYAPRKISRQHIVAALSVRLSVRPSVRPIRVRPITSLFEVRFQKYFTEMITILRRRVACNSWAATSKVKGTAWPFSKKSCLAHNLVIWSQIFTIFSHNWSPYWHDMLRTTLWSLPWRSTSQHGLSAKLFPAHNFVIWSRFKNYFTWMITILRRCVECNI